MTSNDSTGVYLAAVFDTPKGPRKYKVAGGGFTEDKSEAHRYKKHSKALGAAKSAANTGQLYDAEPYTPPAK